MKRGAGSDVYKPIRKAIRKANRLGRNRDERRKLLFHRPQLQNFLLYGPSLMDKAWDEIRARRTR
jgi:hypothetical protein